MRCNVGKTKLKLASFDVIFKLKFRGLQTQRKKRLRCIKTISFSREIKSRFKKCITKIALKREKKDRMECCTCIATGDFSTFESERKVIMKSELCVRSRQTWMMFFFLSMNGFELENENCFHFRNF